MVVLWNMSIRKSVGISLFESLFDVFIGFGVSPVTNDPMIVKLMRVDYECPWENKVIRRLPWQARVFTLSSGTWKSLSKNLPSGTIKITQLLAVFDLEHINEKYVVMTRENSAEMPYDVSETRGNGETRGNAGKRRGNVPKKRGNVSKIVNGELIFRVENDDGYRAGLVSYEPSSELSNIFYCMEKWDLFFVTSYAETLLLLDQVDCSILETFN
ncbi:hypothetical protein Tco_0787305 [Tanacetum coccineum]